MCATTCPQSAILNIEHRVVTHAWWNLTYSQLGDNKKCVVTAPVTMRVYLFIYIAIRLRIDYIIVAYGSVKQCDNGRGNEADAQTTLSYDTFRTCN